MAEVKRETTKEVKKEYTALKNLCTKEGVNIKKGDKFKCSSTEVDHYAQVRAI